MADKKKSSVAAVRNIRRKTRKKYSAEEKISIVLDGLRGETTIAELCRQEGINQNLYYKWSKEFLEAGKQRMAGNTNRQATQVAPRRHILWLNLAWMKEQLGDQQSALEYYRTAYCLNPWYAQTIFFNKTALRKQALEWDCPDDNPIYFKTFTHYLYQAHRAAYRLVNI